jgi:probable F420-dependent oxidoreductase
MTLLSAIASTTKKVRLGPLVLVLPLYHPVQLAKSLATIDYLSKGRLIVGLGVGWNREEFDALGVGLSSRGKMMDECLQILKELWTKDNVSFNGEFFKFSNLTLEPKPVQRPHPPIWIGGGNQPFDKIYGMKVGDVTPALRRIARYSSGWSFHLNSTSEMVSRDWKVITELARQFGRDPGEIEIVYSNFVYVIRREEDLEKCRRAIARITTQHFKEATSRYLIGTADEIIKRLRQAASATGRVDHAVLNPLDWDLAQVQAIKDEVVEELG